MARPALRHRVLLNFEADAEGITADRLIADLPARVVNVDLVVLAEQPRLAPYIPAMRSAIAAALGISPAQVSVKAATNEGLGFVGRGEGIAAYAVALIDP